MERIVTRFAPSPTGYLHLGHAFSACRAAQAASGGKFHLRIEDIDPVRCRPEFTQAIFEDLSWLGLKWDSDVRYQSAHLADYATALDDLRSQGLLYPCFCTRKEIEQEALRSGYAPHEADGSTHYPGTCRGLSEQAQEESLRKGDVPTWRLHVAAAKKLTGDLFWFDGDRKILAEPEIFGDVVLARKDVATSYHLSVTYDDHLQGITRVTRGVDLYTSTHIHRLLQALLGLATPRYDHHPLIQDETGRRFSKRDNAVTLRALREQGETPESLRRRIGISNFID